MENQVTIQDRLTRLEVELDQLLSVQEKNKTKVNLEPNPSSQPRQQLGEQRCWCLNTAGPRRNLVKTRHPLPLCNQHGTGGAPLTDITKFLQNINFNLYKGAQAISKIAASNSVQQLDSAENNRHETCLKPKEPDSSGTALSVLKTQIGNKFDENTFFKELRDEKDKRLRAENQAKNLKDELKKAKTDLQNKTDASVKQLQSELRDTMDKLEQAKYNLEKNQQEFQKAEYLWPIKYENTYKDLQEEKRKRHEAERNAQELQENVKRLFIDTEELLSLRQSAGWLKEQNQSLISLTNKLQTEVNEKTAEMMRKDETVQGNTRQIKQLTCLCGKLRDQLILMREKVVTNEEELRRTMTHCQTLTDTLLHAQSCSEDLKKRNVKDRNEQMRLSEIVKTITATNDTLQTRVHEITMLMKQQNELTSRQSEVISSKDEQLQLAYENIKLQRGRIAELENKISLESDDLKQNQLLIGSKSNKLILELDEEKEKGLIKEKIIESHLQSIMELKNKLSTKEEEVNCKKKEISDLGRKLSMEITTNEQLFYKIKTLQSSKEELKQRVKELEDELEAEVSSEQAQRLEHIETQVRQKQKEWEEQKHKLLNEKENALESLRRAAQELASKSADHRGELAALQSQLDKVNRDLRQKEDHLTEALNKISSLTTELEKTTKVGEQMRKKFEVQLRSACDAWQQSMKFLQNPLE